MGSGPFANEKSESFSSILLNANLFEHCIRKHLKSKDIANLSLTCTLGNETIKHTKETPAFAFFVENKNLLKKYKTAVTHLSIQLDRYLTPLQSYFELMTYFSMFAYFSSVVSQGDDKSANPFASVPPKLYVTIGAVSFLTVCLLNITTHIKRSAIVNELIGQQLVTAERVPNNIDLEQVLTRVSRDLVYQNTMVDDSIQYKLEDNDLERLLEEQDGASMTPS